VGDYDGDYLAADLEWTKSGTGTATTYTFVLDLNTVAINTALGVGEPADLASIPVNFELEFVESGNTTSSQTVLATLHNDVNRGDEESPANAPSVALLRDGTVQTLTTEQKAQVHTNLSLVPGTDVETPAGVDAKIAAYHLDLDAPPISHNTRPLIVNGTLIDFFEIAIPTPVTLLSTGFNQWGLTVGDTNWYAGRGYDDSDDPYVEFYNASDDLAYYATGSDGAEFDAAPLVVGIGGSSAGNATVTYGAATLAPPGSTATENGNVWKNVGTAEEPEWVKILNESQTAALLTAKANIDSQTHTGAHAFSSTTRPTSSGTGAPAGTSLITRRDAILRDMTSAHYEVTNFTGAVASAGGGTGVTPGLLTCSANSSLTPGNYYTHKVGTFMGGSGERQTADFSKMIVLGFGIIVINTTGDSESRYLWPVATAYNNGRLTSKGFGFIHIGDKIYGCSHDGTTHRITTSFVTSPAGNTIHRCMAISNGSGSVEYFVDGTSIGSLTGPTGTQINANSVAINVECGAAEISQWAICQQLSLNFEY
jgi:hypothetical protein